MVAHSLWVSFSFSFPFFLPSLPPRGNFKDKDIRGQAAQIHKWDQNLMEP